MNQVYIVVTPAEKRAIELAAGKESVSNHLRERLGLPKNVKAKMRKMEYSTKGRE